MTGSGDEGEGWGIVRRVPGSPRELVAEGVEFYTDGEVLLLRKKPLSEKY
jgi:hypothetical protein